MTDYEQIKQKAKKYVNNKADTGNYDYALGDNVLFGKSALEKAYIAGAKENGVVWHDLQNNFNDLPEEKHTVILLTEVGPTTAQYDKKFESFFRMNEKLEYCIFIAPLGYVAWCEIPKFEEK